MKTKILKNKKLYALIVIIALALSMAVGAFQFNNKSTASAAEAFIDPAPTAIEMPNNYENVTLEYNFINSTSSFTLRSQDAAAAFVQVYEGIQSIGLLDAQYKVGNIAGGALFMNFCTINLNTAGISVVNGNLYTVVLGLPDKMPMPTFMEVPIKAFYFRAGTAGLLVDYLPSPPEKNGYAFSNWYLDSALTIEYIGQPILSDTTLYAKFIPLVYDITYNYGGVQTNSISNPLTYTIETETITLQNPTSAMGGYTFNGWTEGNSIPKGSTGNKTFTAKWTAVNFSITYNLNGGQNASNPSTYTIETETITLQNPTRMGYAFKGWTEGYFISKGSTGNKTFTATWEIVTYSITYDLDGGANNIDNPTTYTVEKNIDFKPPTREGYSFKSWSTAFIRPNSTTGNITITATWEIIRYKVTFIVDGAEPFSIMVDHGTTLEKNKDFQSLMSVMKLSGYTDEEVKNYLSMEVTEGFELTAEGDKNAMTAVKIVAWVITYWWVLIIIGLAIAGGIGLVVHKKGKK